MALSIPAELVDLLRERRVIPFIGAGFSAALKLPDWNTALKELAPELGGGLTYEQIYEMANGDLLQIAEYYYLKADRSVGPLRYRLTHLLRPSESLLRSTAHIELVNLNPQHIYTTNYDESIESTYKSLGHPYSFVALPKDVASADRGRTQVVKYHGDLRHDSTLVLTESSYYGRLEFESPMDLKFRSDLLGRSVLFIGYSFRDINIRIIWFKLMEMMRDVPSSDRPSSFIMRFEKNPVLEELYKSVGIKTIYLDPDAKAKTPEARSQLLSQFMLELTIRVTDEGKMPGSNTPMFLSTGFIDELRRYLNKDTSGTPFYLIPGRIQQLLRQMSLRRIPGELDAEVENLLTLLAKSEAAPDAAPLAASVLKKRPKSSAAAFVIMRGLTTARGRKHLLQGDVVPWPSLWANRISLAEGELIVKKLRAETAGHQEGMQDSDLAYVVELAKRIDAGILLAGDESELREQARSALGVAAQLYPEIDRIELKPDQPPQVGELLSAIERISESQSSASEEDVPF